MTREQLKVMPINQRRILIIIGAIAVVTGVFGARLWQLSSKTDRLAALESQIPTVDPLVQIHVTQQILDIDDDHVPARLRLAEALIALGQNDAARLTLEPVLNHSDENQYALALGLSIDSCIQEALDLIQTAAPRALDMAYKRIEQLKNNASIKITSLSKLTGTGALTAGYNAAIEDLNAGLIHRKLRQQYTIFAKVRAVDSDNHHLKPAPAVMALKTQLLASHQKLLALCIMARQMDADQTMANACLFRMRLREDDFSGAVNEAKQLIQMPAPPRSLAGEIGDTILNIESTHGGLLSKQDVQVVASLLDHPGMIGCETLRLSLACASLSLNQGDYERAKEAAKAVRDRYPDHPRATALLAMARIGLGQPDHALKLLVPLNDRVRFAEGRYVEAVARLAAGKPQRAHELLRQCIEMNGQHLPALLTLVESLADMGQIDGAARDINAAFLLNPKHPRVLAIYARLIIMHNNRSDFVKRLSEYLQHSSLSASDAIMAGAMIRDDTIQVAAESEQRVESDPGNFVALIGQSWTHAQGMDRAEIAMLVAMVLLDAVDDDPLRYPDPPSPKLLRRRAGASAAPPAEQLMTTHFIEAPHEIALQLMNASIMRWPDQMQLKSEAKKLRDYIAQGSEMAANAPKLDRYLKEHPWAPLPLLNALGAALKQDNIPAVKRMILQAGQVDERLARLVESQVNMSLGHASDALHGATLLMRDDTAGVLLQHYSTELAARAHVLGRSSELAVGMIENLALGAEYRLIPLKLAAADVLLDARLDSEGSAALVFLMMNHQVPARWLDRMLVRTAAVMEPKRVCEITARLLEHRPDDPLVLVYRAWALTQLDDHAAARLAIDLAAKKSGQSARVMMFSASLHVADGQVTEARSIYNNLIAQHGLVAAAAQRELSRLDSAAARGVSP